MKNASRQASNCKQVGGNTIYLALAGFCEPVRAIGRISKLDQGPTGATGGFAELPSLPL